VVNPSFEEWLEKAEEDYNFACRNLADFTIPFFSQICYHFQQAAEKYLKAYIVAYELEFKKIHDLTELLRICQKKEPSFSSLSSACEFLTDFYIETRYPVPWPVRVSREEAKKARKYTKDIRDFIRKILKNK